MRALAYNGLAEVDLQSRRYDTAAESAQQALSLAPGEWVAAYNLGMIEDRRGHSEAVVESLNLALSIGVPDARHRLLIYLYLFRAAVRLGQDEAPDQHLAALTKQRDGLREWQTILGSPEASLLREVLADDVALADDLISGRKQAADLKEQTPS